MTDAKNSSLIKSSKRGILEKEMSNKGNKEVSNEKKSRIIEIEYDKLRKSIDMLYDNLNVNLDTLRQDSDLYKSFEYVLLSMSIFNQTSFEPLISIVDGYEKPKRISPQTCAAFLFGEFLKCYVIQDQDGIDFKTCSSVSISKLPRSKNSVKYKSTGDNEQMWIVREDVAALFRSSKSDKALVFVESSSYSKFEGFTEQNIEAFRDRGVKKVSVVTMNNGVRNTLLDFTDIDNLKLDTSQKTDTSSKDTNSTNYWWILIVVGVIGILFLIVLFASGSSPSRSGYYN